MKEHGVPHTTEDYRFIVDLTGDSGVGKTLMLILQTYIGSRVSVNARTHAGVVNALLTLYQVDPNNKEQGSLKQTASDLYFAVIQLGNVEGYNSEQGDLLAMIGVIRKHKNELEAVASKSFERFDI